MWHRYPNILPEMYKVMGVEVSKPMFTANILTRTNYIASLWITDEKEVWIEYTNGNEVNITHWQEIHNPEN